MKLIACVSFYDEKPEHIATCLHGLHQLGAHHVIALDGAYAMYPDAQPASDPAQHACIVLSCRQLDMGLTLEIPTHPWAGNEMEKRTKLFALAWAQANEGDWFVIQDIDQTPDPATIPNDLHHRLATSKHDVAEITMRDIPAVQANHPSWPKHFKIPSFFRAQPITVTTNHYTYQSPRHDLPLWDGSDGHDPVTNTQTAATRLNLLDLVFEHRPHLRTEQRLQAKQQYYAARDTSGIELGECEQCHFRQAKRRTEIDWQMTELGPAANVIAACDHCYHKLRPKARAQMRALGLDPDTVPIAHRYGRPADLPQHAAA